MNLAYKKILGKFTKVLGFGKTPPPCWEKFPNNVVFFLRAYLIQSCFCCVWFIIWENSWLSLDWFWGATDIVSETTTIGICPKTGVTGQNWLFGFCHLNMDKWDVPERKQIWNSSALLSTCLSSSLSFHHLILSSYLSSSSVKSRYPHISELWVKPLRNW